MHINLIEKHGCDTDREFDRGCPTRAELQIGCFLCCDGKGKKALASDVVIGSRAENMIMDGLLCKPGAFVWYWLEWRLPCFLHPGMHVYLYRYLNELLPGPILEFFSSLWGLALLPGDASMHSLNPQIQGRGGIFFADSIWPETPPSQPWTLRGQKFIFGVSCWWLMSCIFCLFVLRYYRGSSMFCA